MIHASSSFPISVGFVIKEFYGTALTVPLGMLLFDPELFPCTEVAPVLRKSGVKTHLL